MFNWLSVQCPASPKSDSGIVVSHTKPDTSNEYTLYHSETKEVLPQELYNQYQDAKVVFTFDNTVKTDTLNIDHLHIPRVSLEVRNTNVNKELAFKLHDLIETTYPGLSKGIQIQAGPQIDKNAPADAIIINLGHTLGSSEEKYEALEIVQKIIKES
ncbi:stage II sporulation protein P [Rossellomorea marisflavi]|uniref:stage II sporulation protein P n=1 Tax=Rossellomorea marisflavi TaxID=189381 RepID=UPI003ADDD377